jgi:hypothetical protein
VRGDLLEYNWKRTKENDVLSIKVKITEPNYTKDDIKGVFDFLADPDDDCNYPVKKNKKGILVQYKPKDDVSEEEGECMKGKLVKWT